MDTLSLAIVFLLLAAVLAGYGILNARDDDEMFDPDARHMTERKQ